MLKFGPFDKIHAQVVVAQIRALCDEDDDSVRVLIDVDEASLSENDRLLLRASKGETTPPPVLGAVDEALAFLSWFQLGEGLKVFDVRVEGAQPELAARIAERLGD
ncbi:MAG: hypothetical protein JSR86_08490 [Proteobacteria bacterium]|nr:hypothetical protein [Pseudomonadota bacterium]